VADRVAREKAEARCAKVLVQLQELQHRFDEDVRDKVERFELQAESHLQRALKVSNFIISFILFASLLLSSLLFSSLFLKREICVSAAT
jgi:hypothetical protein